MKNFKKIASAIAALSLAACMVAPVATMTSFAEEPTYTITINPGADSSSDAAHTYVAYQIFKGDLSGAGTPEDPFVLANPDWGEGVNASAALTAAQGISELNGCTTVADIIKELSKNTVKDNELAMKFAAAMAGEGVLNSEKAKPETGVDVIGNLAPGYYLVMDSAEPTTEGSAKPNSSAQTRYILQVVGNVSVTAKVAAPSVDKQVLDNDTADSITDKTEGAIYDASAGGVWGETADHEMNEKFQFKLVADLPESDELDKYETYTLQFNDTWSNGVTYLGEIKLKVGGHEITLTGTGEGGAIDFTKDGADLTGNFEWKVADNSLTIKINDLKKYLTAAEAASLSNLDVEVVYSAMLNNQATVTQTSGATNNQNAVNLEYSNNPNNSGEGSFDSDDNKGKTPNDIVWVYTYEVDSTKVDGANPDTKLPDAKFKLYKEVGSEKKYAKMEETTSATGVWTIKDWVSEAEATEMATPSTGTFNVKGLDAGTYYIKETEAPKGYNKLEKDIKIVIEGEHKEEGTSNKVTLKMGKGDTPDAEVTPTEVTDTAVNYNIENNKGASLPSTGGIGTTLFYLGGGALVAVAGVMLITKKRMTKE